ncbi:MAG: NAD(P)/FAD-dependent oxidoreductase, partial [Proteobacteria bacterium]|nr:NAD(P)/FAD-dependent oxidoreductase [Pseudomonadota bacterium]
VGAGPAGSSCAHALSRAGIDAWIIDRAEFPRDKVCGGWITPHTIASLGLDLAEYGSDRTLQPITGFSVGVLGGPLTTVDYGRTVSHAIRRREFDHYLLTTSGARQRLGEAVQSIERVAGGWCVNGSLHAQLLVGAGGNGCPVARHLGLDSAGGGEAFAGEEVEYRLDAALDADCMVARDMPALYFCNDLRGYGWAVRKGDYINIGLGRLGAHRLGEQVHEFHRQLIKTGVVAANASLRFRGHAYLSRECSNRRVCGEGALLIGDAAGLSDARSGEGIRAAVESGLLAAATIVAAHGDFRAERLARHSQNLEHRFGPPHTQMQATGERPDSARTTLGRWLLGRPAFVRHVVLNRWFLHDDLPALLPTQAARGSMGDVTRGALV